MRRALFFIIVLVLGLGSAGLLTGSMIHQAEASPSASVQQMAIQVNNIFLPSIINCIPLYFDNFSNLSSGWPTYDNPDELLQYNNGEYQIVSRSTNWATGTHPNFQASNYSVTIDVRNPNNIFGSYGIGFGIASDWSTLYTFEVYPDGWFGLYRIDPAGFATLAEAYSGFVNQGSASNQLKIERNGSSIMGYVNGQLLASVTDGTYTGSRYIGLVVSSYDNGNLDIRFDNFRVDAISCAGTQTTEKSFSNLNSPGSIYLNKVERSVINKQRP